MPKVTYRTTWQEAQRLLLDNVDFVNDTELQSKENKLLHFYQNLNIFITDMDKEDALIVFEDHIRDLEKVHEEEVEAQRKYIRRTNRKNREAFLVRISFLKLKKTKFSFLLVFSR